MNEKNTVLMKKYYLKLKIKKLNFGFFFPLKKIDLFGIWIYSVNN